MKQASQKIMLQILIPAVIFPAAASAKSDAEIEKQLHKTYKKFVEKSTDEKVWDQSLTNKNIFQYDVQSGDTLWDLSQTLFGDSQFWPKIWSLNVARLANPHEISQGQKINFTPGTAESAPSIATDSSTAANTKPADGKPINMGLQTDTKKREPYHPPTATFQFPQPIESPYSGAFQKIEIKSVVKNPPVQVLMTELYDEEPKYLGEVVEIESGLKTASAPQNIFIKMSENSHQSLRVVANLGRLTKANHPNPPLVIRNNAIIEIGELVNPDEKIYRAVIKRSFHLVSLGDHILAGGVREADMGAPAEFAQIEAEIIGGDQGQDESLSLGRGIVYLNAGRKAGLREGVGLHVRANSSRFNPQTVVQQTNKEIGILKVVALTDDYALAFVTDMKEAFGVGDRTLGLPPKPSESTAASDGLSEDEVQ
jgi:hypothetical protein